MVVKVGQTRSTIYKTPYRGCDGFTVVWYVGPSRKRKLFADLDAAKLHAQAQVSSLSLGESEILRLSGEDRLSYVRAREAVREFEVSLDTAANEYRDARRLLKGGSLLEAARFYAARHLLEVPDKGVEDVVTEMLAAKREEGLSKRYLQDLESRASRFAKAFHVRLANVKGADVKAWLQGMKVGNRSRNNFGLAIQTVFSFAKAQKYLPKDWSELEAVPLWKTQEEEIEVFTPAEMRRLLETADAGLVPFLAIGAFAGLRSAEIERLDWGKVDFEAGFIRVDASIAKTNSRRLVPMLPNLRGWLEPRAKKSGPVVELANVPNAIQRLTAAMNDTSPQALTPSPSPSGRARVAPDSPQGGEGASNSEFVWKHNALRHSFISYRVAQIQNVAQVALEAGNSPQMIFKHYRELVRPKEAEAWFNIVPEKQKAESGKQNSEDGERRTEGGKPADVVELKQAA
jgi:integrase